MKVKARGWKRRWYPASYPKAMCGLDEMTIPLLAYQRGL